MIKLNRCIIIYVFLSSYKRRRDQWQLNALFIAIFRKTSMATIEWVITLKSCQIEDKLCKIDVPSLMVRDFEW